MSSFTFIFLNEQILRILPVEPEMLYTKYHVEDQTNDCQTQFDDVQAVFYRKPSTH